MYSGCLELPHGAQLVVAAHGGGAHPQPVLLGVGRQLVQRGRAPHAQLPQPRGVRAVLLQLYTLLSHNGRDHIDRMLVVSGASTFSLMITFCFSVQAFKSNDHCTLWYHYTGLMINYKVADGSLDYLLVNLFPLMMRINKIFGNS